MLYVNNDGTIRLTRGDTARISVTVYNDYNQEDYELDPADVLRLTIKKSVRDTTPAVQKMITGSSQFYLLPTDTQDLSFGKYLYDVELTTSSGDVYTIIEPTTFEILKEVTC